MPWPSSLTRISRTPPSSSSTVMRPAPASRAFSTSSFTTDDGRSMTSPAAILAATAGGSTPIRPRAATGALDDMGGLLAGEPALRVGAPAFEAGAPREAVREALHVLERGLVERIHAEQAGDDHGLHL